MLDTKSAFYVFASCYSPESLRSIIQQIANLATKNLDKTSFRRGRPLRTVAISVGQYTYIRWASAALICLSVLLFSGLAVSRFQTNPMIFSGLHNQRVHSQGSSLFPGRQPARRAEGKRSQSCGTLSSSCSQSPSHPGNPGSSRPYVALTAAFLRNPFLGPHPQCPAHQPQGLPSRACANFDTCEHSLNHHLLLPDNICVYAQSQNWVHDKR